MPIYNFKCPNCKKKTEELIRGKTKKKIFCPICKNEMTKTISIFSFGFEGYLAGNRSGQK